MVLFKRTLLLFIVLLFGLASANAEIMQGGKTVPSFKQDAASIRHTYETQLYTLSAFKAGHYGLRMYRQTMDPKYSAAVWSDMARVASRLNQFSSEVHTPEQIDIYAQKRLSSYVDDTDIRSTLRYQATKNMPEYFYLGVDLLGSMARANEYGLKHRNDKQLREIIRRYDFKKYATDEAMIKAWAAQLANQVYWLRQLGEQDVVDEFVEAFKLAYPDNKDAALSKQQYGNKIYGLTHILLADSQYYQYPLKESDHQWIYDYLRNNIDTILKRTKEDIISEVGITFLLAGLEDDPVVYKTQKHIQDAINREKNMVPSTSNSTDLTDGEHRNVLAIMLLDWQTPHAAPTIQNEPKVFKSKPYGLVKK
ncbi:MULTISPECIES: DUF3541 domain-containing protein [Aliivibrio]|uniref:DUF3541 domain-containing protein n=1 Tax=Aliivibrio finisterrensis TaxID=511998 RepID=A0A4Q5KV33_9GAMM|nr:MULTISPECIES: DUF3541 domain-containing protein [Aliivibrio]MDD9177892.1 DUF3541 domain-containing protein [Aliivibrio sp. A6]RYU52130.1 DUF3541 domain-containing protein [Aliivibrio finisterrensis]RYU53973.1 DUF3541 domain-containing protein [Aliivibrio finisterrensis]RYU59180.1 DUF3541 domain-containing protein [Aliivibrio finisterrensis]RYU65176.1 DUF3541 domain-containing protein [Aliivibrio finisterrensis]